MRSIRTVGRKHNSTWIFLLLLQVTILTPVNARVWLVLIDGSGDQPTIQAAVNASANLDTILVGPGTYLENVQLTSKTLTFLSQQGRDKTVIQQGLSLANGSKVQASGFTFTGPSHAVSIASSFSRSTFVNCAFVNCGGAGVRNVTGGVTLDSCIVANNQGSGLALFEYEFASGTCTNSEFRDNGGAGMAGTNFNLDNCVISGNDGNGVSATAGARDFHTYQTTISHSVITGNGGCAMTASSDHFNNALIQVSNSTISNNVGGGMDGGTGWSVSFTLDDCAIFDNGGVGVAQGRPGVTMRKCVIRGNAGGIDALKTPHVQPSPGSVTLESCTYHDNGGGITAERTVNGQAGRITLTKSILSNNTGGVAVCGAPTFLTLSVNCTNLFSNGGADTVCAGSGSNNFSLDPQYCDPEGGDLTLAASSPCAPENSPSGCSLIGALPVGCGVTGIAAPGSTPTAPDFALRVSPNPIAGNAVVEWLAEKPRELRLYNALGRLVAHRDLSEMPLGVSSVRWESLVRRSELAPGVYYLEAVHPVTSAPRATRVVVLH
jgi:hypothetical protein